MSARPYVTSEPLTVELDLREGAQLIRSVCGADGTPLNDIGWLKLYVEGDTRPEDVRATVYRSTLVPERGIVVEHAGVSTVSLRLRG